MGFSRVDVIVATGHKNCGGGTKRLETCSLQIEFDIPSVSLLNSLEAKWIANVVLIIAKSKLTFVRHLRKSEEIESVRYRHARHYTFSAICKTQLPDFPAVLGIYVWKAFARFPTM